MQHAMNQNKKYYTLKIIKKELDMEHKLKNQD